MIAVLGSGLSGLLVARALDRKGMEFEILSKEKKVSEPMGFCLLHDNCDMTLCDEIIEVIQSGRKERYKEKLGYSEEVNSSWRDGIDKYYLHGYDIYTATDILFQTFKDNIQKETIKPDDLKNLQKEYNKIISTIPPNNLDDSINLKYREIYVAKRDNNKRLTPKVIYHGDEGIALRSTLNLWGKSWTEFSDKPNNTDFEAVRKPIGYNGNLEDLPAINVGRFGRWDKRVLAHNVYYRIKGLIRDGKIS